MKDFTLSKNEKQKYIKKVSKVNRLSGIKCYEIKYADGRKFKNIVCQEENLAKIINAQEEQAKTAYNNRDVFIKKEKKFKFLSLAGVITTGIFGLISTTNVLKGNGLRQISIAAGTICAGTTLVSFLNYLKNKGKVAELKKIDYRNKNIKDLNNFYEYENSLQGLNKFKQSYFKKTKDPFNILEIDNYSKKDLETIMSNIKREKEYKFKYYKKQLKKVK